MVTLFKIIKNMNFLKYSAITGVSALLAIGTVACKNGSQDFPDYEGGITAYFANQYPVKTITLGEDGEQDNSLDKQHKCVIYATQGGAYKSRDLKIEVVVDNSLVNNLTFSDGSPVKVMPTSYYSLETTTLYKKKDYLFGTEVTLTDAFFADPDAIKTTYVIPLRMISAQGADQIITGTPVDANSNPARCDASAWEELPKDYVLYGIKYINPWHASYLRRGVDQITQNGTTTNNVRHKEYVEKDEVVYLTTTSLTQCTLPISAVVPDGESIKTVTCDLTLTFNGDDVTVTTSTPGMTASGTGKYVTLGEKKSWDNQDRDGLYLNYKIDFGAKQYSTQDTLVMRLREVAPIFDFNPTYNN
jgi:hypothetical protein